MRSSDMKTEVTLEETEYSKLILTAEIRPQKKVDEAQLAIEKAEAK